MESFDILTNQRLISKKCPLSVSERWNPNKNNILNNLKLFIKYYYSLLIEKDHDSKIVDSAFNMKPQFSFFGCQ